jgi:hypothetical protein
MPGNKVPAIIFLGTTFPGSNLESSKQMLLTLSFSFLSDLGFLFSRVFHHDDLGFMFLSIFSPFRIWCFYQLYVKCLLAVCVSDWSVVQYVLWRNHNLLSLGQMGEASIWKQDSTASAALFLCHGFHFYHFFKLPFMIWKLELINVEFAMVIMN